jgi:predicted short-subunit dehydrogenase-like oxidoreductase (DUF2520 family)
VLQCGYTSTWEKLEQGADLFLMAVSDDGMAGLAGRAIPGNKLILHTAGSVPIDILSAMSNNYGVFYPLQSLKKEIKTLPEIPLLVDGNTDDVRALVVDLGRSISGNVLVAGDETRYKMHIAAVMVNNFCNHLYALAESYCEQEQLDFHLLLPLIEETAIRIQQFPPSQMQTGPAARQDIKTIEKHLDYLQAYPQIREIYQLFTQSIGKFE